MKAFTKQLWIIRCAYFCFCAGQATILPYISVYMKQSGITRYEATIISSLTPIVSLLTRPLFGLLADRLRIHKTLVIICLVVNAVIFALVNLVPTRTQPEESAGLNNTFGNSSLAHLNDQLSSNSNSNSSSIVVMVTEKDGGGGNSGDQEYQLVFIWWLVLRTSAFAFLYPAYSLLDATTYMVLDPHREVFGSCRFVGSIGYCVASIAAAAILQLVAQNNQINFFAVSSIYIGFTVSCCLAVVFFRFSDFFRQRRDRHRNQDQDQDQDQNQGQDQDQEGKTKKSVATSEILRDLRRQLCLGETQMLFLYLFTFGYSNGLWNGYMYWMFSDLGAGALHIGMTLALSSFCEILAVRFSGVLIGKFTEPGCLIGISLLSTLEFLGYALVTQPWLLLLPQPLTGFNFGLNVVAHSVYVTRLSSARTIGAMHGIASCVYVGLGQTASALFGGYLYVNFGSFMLQISCVVQHAFCTILYLIVYFFHIRRRKPVSDPTAPESEPKMEAASELDNDNDAQAMEIQPLSSA